ncbi:YfjI family protein, partial [Kitasatospora sp. NPDC048194]|uniref:YfjI family protein n=1 Tax=Kitasatospora sp. NPDC048194 TaxID=3364045 RepID=UPI003718C930
RWRRDLHEPCERKRHDAELTEHIRRIHADSDRTQLMAEISAAKMLAEQITVPPTPRLTLSGDITPETVTSQLAVHRCLAALSPEGDLFDSIVGRYSSKPNLGVFLQAHKGERLQVDRITREQTTIDKPALTIGATPQPAVLQELGAASGARDRGLLARFLYSLPPSNLGYRKIRTEPIPERAANAYDRNLTRLLRAMADLTEPVVVLMDQAADLAIERLQERVEVQLRPDQPLFHIKDWAGKLVGHIARIAVLLHLADHIASDQDPGAWRGELDAATVERAAEIADYYTAHTLAVFDLIAADPATEDAHAILQWLQRPKKDGTHRTHIKAHDAVASSRRFKKVADVEPALTLLEQHGYLRSDQAGPTGQRGRPQAVTYRVHPSIGTPVDGAEAR